MNRNPDQSNDRQSEQQSEEMPHPGQPEPSASHEQPQTKSIQQGQPGVPGQSQEAPAWPQLPLLPEQPEPGTPTTPISMEGRPQAGYPAWPYTQAQSPPQTWEQPQQPDYPQDQYPQQSHTQQTPAQGAGSAQFGQAGQPTQAVSPGDPTYAGFAPPPGPPPQVMPPYPALPEKRRGWPLWAWVSMGVVLIACLGCVAFGVLGTRLFGQFVEEVGEPIGVVAGYQIAMQTHNYDKAHEYFSDTLARSYSIDDLEAAWVTLENEGDVRSSTTGEFNVVNNEATVEWRINVEGQQRSTTLTLRKIGNEWKITSGDPDLVPQP